MQGNIKSKLLQVLGEAPFSELQQAVEEGELSEEAVEQLRAEVEEQMLSLLGPLQWVLVDIPILSDLEDAAADWALGEELEEVRDAVANLELPESVFEPVCEVQ